MSSWGFRFFFLVIGFGLGVRSEAEILCSLLFALQDPTPVRMFVWVSLSLSLFLLLFGCFLSAVVACLSFSPLQALGKHKPRCGLWFPLCSFLAALFFLDPYSRYRNYTKAWLPHLLFLSFSWFVFVVGVSLSLSLSLALCFSLLSLSGVGRPGCACRYDRIHGGGLQDGAPNYNHDCFFGLLFGEEHRTVPRTARPELSVLPPISSRSPLKQGPEEEMGEATVLSHKCVR